MAAYQIKTVVREDRKLIIELPEDFPAGEVNVQVETVLQPARPEKQASDTMTPEKAREILRAAGKLATNIQVPPDAVLLTPEERMRAGTLAPGARDSLDLINEDRGEW